MMPKVNRKYFFSHRMGFSRKAVILIFLFYTT